MGNCNNKKAPILENHQVNKTSSQQIQENNNSNQSKEIEMSANKIIIFMGTVRTVRLGERVTTAVKDVVSSNGMEPIIMDPAELPLELVKLPLHFMTDPDNEAPEWLLEWNNKIINADGFIVVSAEYNCGIPPALSNMLDHFPTDSFRHRPCGIITYSHSAFGGIRVKVILRPFIAELGMVSIPFYVAIPNAQEAIEENGKFILERVESNMVKLVKEVKWYADALRKHKEFFPLP